MNNLTSYHCTIVVLTFSGEIHLKYLLPTIEEAIDSTSDYKINVLVVDNAQSIDTKSFVEYKYPSVGYFSSPVNEYLFSLNPVVKEIKSPLVFILNDDMKMHKDALRHTIPLMIENENLFSVNCKVMNWDGEGQQSNVRELRYSKNSWMESFWSQKIYDEPAYTLYGGGGFAMFRTALFNNLGGFDNLFKPAYCEDLDLGHRSWHLGYENIFHPKAILYHRDGATIKEQFENDSLSILIYRNRILEMLKNSRFNSFLFNFLIYQPYRLLFGWRVDILNWKALWSALPRLYKALKKRRIINQEKSEKEIIDMIGKTYNYV